MAESPIDAVLIHAVYLLNCASEDPDIRAKSLTSLTHSLRVGQRDRRARRRAASGLGQDRRRRRGDRPRRRDDRARRSPRARAARCTSRTPPARAARSDARSTSSRRCSRRPAADERLGLCLDSCHLFASGYDIRTAEGMDSTLTRGDRAKLGLERVRLAAPQRLADAARLKPRPPREHRRGRARRGGLRRVPLRARPRRSCRACSRPRARTARGPTREEVALAMKLRERGMRRARKRRAR